MGFAVGLLVGGLAVWEGARRWERASWAIWWASAWMGEAARLTGRAAGWLLLVGLVVGGGAALLWWAL
ncbi:hypothetical protein [Solwaraspora sp. WMMD792]|uniref:hypothetical protein n=1 Tax=Solwaraspora sp. WMMD792 TaxID=3016099 RepID=UPI0024162065|nr:hypothetical protein [Solwaraspora sp. WMMD792]MDG4770687.1 hypothetical protein [Solwaraspora sp. WMMD792]